MTANLVMGTLVTWKCCKKEGLGLGRPTQITGENNKNKTNIDFNPIRPGLFLLLGLSMGMKIIL